MASGKSGRGKRTVIQLGKRAPLSGIKLWCREVSEDTVIIQFGLAGRKPGDLSARDVKDHVADINRQWQARARENKRASPRIDVALKVAIGSDRRFHAALTENISAGGLFVATRNLRVIGAPLTVRLTLPNSDRPLAVDAEVRWIRESARDSRSQPAGMGLRFVDLPGKTSAAINSFLAKRRSRTDHRPPT